MREELTTIELEAQRKAWLRRLCDEYLKLEPLMPFKNPLSTAAPDEGPKWLQNVEMEIGAVMYPLAKLKEDFNLTPRRMGGFIGHSCALGVWMMEGLEHEMKRPSCNMDLSKFTPEQLEQGKKIFLGLVNDWYPALRRFAKRALCSCVDQSYEDMTEFLLAYSEAFSRKPRRLGLADIGNPTAEIYFLC